MSKHNFPHPVLTSNNLTDSDFKNSSFDVKIKYKSDIGFWVFYIDNKIDNEAVMSLINNEKARVLLTVKSRQSFFIKKVFIQANNEFELRIKKEDIKSKVIIKLSIIMLEDHDIAFEDLNSDYYDLNTFNIKKNELVGISDDFTVDIHPSFVNDTPIQSDKLWFFEPTDKDYIWYKPEDEKITIYMPKSDYKAWKNLDGRGYGTYLDSDYRMKYLVPVLVDIYSNIKNDPEYSYKWLEELKTQCRENDINMDDPFDAAQRTMKLIMSGQDTYTKSWQDIDLLIKKVKREK